MTSLTQTLSANGSTTGIPWSGNGTMFATGTFGSGSLKIQFSPDGGTTWLDGKDASGSVMFITAPDLLTFSVGNCYVRANLTGAATSPSIKVSIQPR